MTTPEQRKETLDELFTRLIADADQVPLDKVTVEYILQEREKRFYGSTRYNVSSSYGGHNLIGLASLTRDESDRIGSIIDEIMQK